MGSFSWDKHAEVAFFSRAGMKQLAAFFLYHFTTGMNLEKHIWFSNAKGPWSGGLLIYLGNATSATLHIFLTKQ